LTNPNHTVFAVITGGGTSGHVVPALAIAELLIDAGHASQQLHIIGTINGIETALVPPTQIPLTLLDVCGFSRDISFSSLKRNIRAIRALRRATKQAEQLLRALKPQVLVSVGGYGSVAATRAASKLGIPVVTVSYDRRPGLATKLQARRAVATAVAYLPTKLRRATHTGAPVRRVLRTLDIASSRNSARQRLGLPDSCRVLAVIGGSLGSETLNAMTRQIVETHGDRDDLCVVHLTGQRYINTDVPQLGVNPKLIYRRIAYIGDMASIYAASDLVVARAGASTIAEIATVGQASVFIPWKQATENHQMLNAQWLAEQGGTVVLDEDVCTVSMLADKVVALLDDRNKLASLAMSARIAGTVHRESKLGALIIGIASTASASITSASITSAEKIVNRSSELDLSSSRRIHVVGVGGTGMSAVATVLAEMGHQVSGSDVRESEVIERLRQIGIAINIGHQRDVVSGCYAVTGSPAIAASNIEYHEALKQNIRISTRAEILASICRRAQSIGVAGTHGKTTTASMLTTILIEAGKDPSYLIGGDVTDFGRGASWKSRSTGGSTGGSLFVVEADESDGTHVQLPLAGAILTNIDVDHLDYFITPEAIVESFNVFVNKINGPRVLCVDDPACFEIARNSSVISYATSSNDAKNTADFLADFTASEISFRDGCAHFIVYHKQEGEQVKLGDVSIALRGMHNVRNALGALAMAMQLGVSFADAVRALANFGGVARRFDLHGTHDGVTYVDDYAHLPNEIAAVLAGARDESDSWTRVVAVFQPNRFNRMSMISHLYANAFNNADLVVVTDIFASGTTPIAGVTGELVVQAVRQAHPYSNVVYRAQRDDLVEFLSDELEAGDLCISMGCGDIAILPSELIARRKVRRLVNNEEFRDDF